MWFLLHLTLLLPVIISAMPGQIGKSASFSASFEDSGPPPLISFDKGGVGVGFLGYHASAGLGGLLTGDAADGGLHAEAGTPFGQSAGAGLGGSVGGGGRAAGGLFAGATAGGGVQAGAGLAGATGASGSVGTSFAGASSGGVETHITKITHKAPVVASGKITASVSAPAVHHEEVEVIEEQPKPQTTYIERTVIPNYVEKTIQVPSYVEKTIRVPTTIEKKVRVAAEPTIIEKTVEAPAAPAVNVRGSFSEEVEVPQTVTYVQKTKFHRHRRPHFHSRTYYKNVGFGGGSGGYGGGGFAGGFGGGFGGFGGGYGGGYGGYGGNSGGSGHYRATVTKTANPQLFNDIFNIPISTLGAVSKLVSGIAGGASGSLSVSKSFGASSF